MKLEDVKIIRPFDGEYIITQEYHSKHRAIDWAMPESTPIIACDWGVVSKVSFDPKGWGNYAIIRHMWGLSLYAHLSEVLVEVGQMVRIAGMVGKSGNTGRCIGKHGGYHLHFETQHKGTLIWNWFDPRTHFRSRGELASTKCPHCGRTIML